MIVEMLAGLTTGLSLWTVVQNVKARKAALAVEPTCTGYRAYIYDEADNNTKTYRSRTDCKGLRSYLCRDGRCSLHCSETCKCEASNEPEHIGRKR